MKGERSVRVWDLDQPQWQLWMRIRHRCLGLDRTMYPKTHPLTFLLTSFRRCVSNATYRGNVNGTGQFCLAVAAQLP